MQSTPWQQRQQQVVAAATCQQVRIHTQHACFWGVMGMVCRGRRYGVCVAVTAGQLSKHMLLCNISLMGLTHY